MTNVAVVTGGTSGIGGATADRLFQNGWGVVVADLSAERGAEQVAAAGSERMKFVATDVSREADIAAAITHAIEAFGRLDCMVNNAGVGGAFGPLTELHVEDWDYTFAVNVRGCSWGPSMQHGS